VFCPTCNSSDLRAVPLIHAAGVYESRGRFGGLLPGGGEGLFFGRYRGTNQNRLSGMLRPPTRWPFISPVILWLAGFFVAMAFAADGKLPWIAGLVSVAYVFFLPAYLLAALFYNFVLRPGKYAKWESTMMCQRCGALTS
jgi:hypothetical protein